MPIRDEREFESRRQQIIDGALQVFSSKGFEKATNKDIADAAGIGSAGLIYHYFQDKSDLFRRVIEERMPAMQVLARSDQLRERPPREVLTLLGTAALKQMANPMNVSLFKLMLGEALRKPVVAEMLTTVGPLRGITVLAGYLEYQMEIGALRRMDPSAAARCFMGPLMAYIITREVFHQPEAQALSPEAMVATAVEIFLQGMEVGVAEGSQAR
jgi:TetR/AcrR family transcriptional repressor of mexJK operon